MKAILIVSKEGKLTIENLPPNSLIRKHNIDCDILFSVGNKEPKRVSLLNKNLFAEAQAILEDNVKSSHIGWYSLSAFIDYLEENYNINKKDIKP